MRHFCPRHARKPFYGACLRRREVRAASARAERGDSRSHRPPRQPVPGVNAHLELPVVIAVWHGIAARIEWQPDLVLTADEIRS